MKNMFYRHNSLTAKSASKDSRNVFQKKDAFYLKFLDVFQGFFQKQGLDYRQLRLLVQVKMAMNGRAMAGPFGQKASKGETRTFSMLSNILIQLFMGVMMAFLLVSSANPFYLYLIVFASYFIFLISATVPQLAQIFLSEEDLELLPVRPVDAQVLSWSKILQVLIYQGITLFSFGLPLVIFSVIFQGFISAIIALLMLILLGLFNLFLSFALYLFLAQYYPGEKLRDVIAYTQIALTISMIISFQFIGRGMEFLEGMVSGFQPPLMLFPISWFSAPFLLSEGEVLWAIIGSVLAVLVTAGLIYYYMIRSKQFEIKIAHIMRTKTSEKKSYRLSNLWGRLLCNRHEERACYDFTARMLRNERNFKTASYPAIAIYMLIPYIMLFSFGNSEMELLSIFSLRYFPSHLFVYINFVVLTFMFRFAEMSDNHMAGWIFQVSPTPIDATLATALVKKLWSSLYVPLMIPQIVYWGLVRGRVGVLSMVIVTLLMYFLMSFSVRFMKLYRPFTRKRRVVQNEGCGSAIIFGIISLVFAGLHFFIEVFWGSRGLLIYAILLLIAFVLHVKFYIGKKEFLSWQ